jgi:hypothetical protein
MYLPKNRISTVPVRDHRQFTENDFTGSMLRGPVEARSYINEPVKSSFKRSVGPSSPEEPDHTSDSEPHPNHNEENTQPS